MFQNATNFNQDISSWNTLAVTNMSQMFQNATNFNQNIGTWITSSVTNMSQMFQNATNFNQSSIGNWNFSKITNINNFITYTKYSLSNCLSFFSNLANNANASNLSFGIIPGIRSTNYNTISSSLNSKNITFTSPDTYANIVTQNQLLTYIFTITYNSSIVFTGLIITDLYNNVIYIEDSTNTGVNIVSFDYLQGATYVFANNTFIGPVNVISIPNLQSQFPSTIEYQIVSNNTINCYSSINSNIYTPISVTINVQYQIHVPNRLNYLFQQYQVPMTKLIELEYTILELYTGGYTVKQLSNIYSIKQLVDGLITINQLFDAGFSVQQLIAAGVFKYNCFNENTKILTNNGYVFVQDLKNGDLIKTLNDDYKPINIIGKKDIYHPAIKTRIKEQLYKCSHIEYPDLFEDLIITGCHSILVDSFKTEEEIKNAIQINEDRLCMTDGKFRLPACVDERASVYEIPGTYTIYHFALENNDYYANYGIYANGLLVETSSKRYMKELSEMEFIK